jgi:hypothetical protein
VAAGRLVEKRRLSPQSLRLLDLRQSFSMPQISNLFDCRWRVASIMVLAYAWINTPRNPQTFIENAYRVVLLMMYFCFSCNGYLRNRLGHSSSAKRFAITSSIAIAEIRF